MKKTTYLLLIILIILSVGCLALATISQGAETATVTVTTITSESYIVSMQNQLISRILPQTTIETVKQSFNVNSSMVHVYDSEGKQEINKGYIGTGMKITVDNHAITYTASVIGDLTGDGEIKQIEVSKIIKHVVGLEKYQLEGIKLISADINGDEKVNQQDVSLCIKYVVYGKLEIGELTKPTAPTISFVSGTEGENGWYTSNVVLKVTEPKTSQVPISNMTYEIIGTVNKEESTIKNEELITIEQEGIYEIKCYSNTKAGVKSEASTIKIKIDKTEPISANLIANIENENGASYTFGSSTNHSVYLRTDGGQDDISGIQDVTIEATGATTIPKGTKTPIIIENNGTTEITITTKNNAGYITTKNYIIIIDKVIKNPGTLITKLNNQNGELYTSNTWTNQNVYVEVQSGGEGINTTYQVEGANTIAETSTPNILTNSGVSTITLINKDEAGNVSKNTVTVKIDKQAPQAPTLQVTGDKILEDSDWYTSQVQVKVEGTPKTSGAPIKKIEYQLKDTSTETNSEGVTDIQSKLTIAREGIYELTIVVVDEAGNYSEKTTEEIKIDTSNPVAGTMNLYKNNQNGQVYLNNTWTNQSIYAELVDGTDYLSGHATTTYQISGQVDISKRTDAITLSQEGIYNITVTTTDVSGRSSQRIYQVCIDKQKPDAPTINIISGDKSDPRNEWYISNVVLEIIQGTIDKGGSGISHTTYEVLGSTQIQESGISDHGTITVMQDGIYNITVYNYDVAGNKSDGTTITIKLDKTAPQNIQINQSEVVGSSFHLQIVATEETSGMSLYQIYVDGELYKEVETTQNTIDIDVTNQTSGPHTIVARTKDIAGNENQAEATVKMGRLEIKDIDYIEFVINNFTQTKDGETAESGAEFIISDTSVSEATKYIQVGAQTTGIKGEITGSIRIIRKDGTIVNEFEYYPDNLLLEMAQYSDGSGSKWEHNASINVANTILTNEDIEEGTNNNANVNINDKQNSDNIFSISDEKVTGTKTYTRLIIKQITLNGDKVPFKISSRVI